MVGGAYLEALARLGQALETDRAEFLAAAAPDLQSTTVSERIVAHMRAHYLAQNQLKLIVKRSLGASAADAFVDAVAFHLDIALRSHGAELDVRVERSVLIDGRRTRPDISIWRTGQLVGFIECKTQLGRSRYTWSKEFDARCAALATVQQDAVGALVIMTAENWDGLDDADEATGVRHFVLSRPWPSRIKGDVREALANPIEPFIRELIARHT